jgi:diguanylate cyclase (GGDEF)-like protein
MLKDDLISLGLRLRRQSGQEPAPAAGSPAPSPLTPLRGQIERLLTLLRDFVAVIDLGDEGALYNRVEACRKVVASAAETEPISASVDACNDACRLVLAKIDRQRLEQKREIANLVSMVREALAIVSGDAQSFNKNIGTSMDRMEALVRIDDLAQLKSRLVHEVGTLRAIATERQKTFEMTCAKFTERVLTLERQLAMAKEEAGLDPLTRIPNRAVFNRACRQWLTCEHGDFALAMIDIDSFKAINDAHGHAVGDRALVAVAHALKNSVRQGVDIVARVGGDEFAVLISELNLRQAEGRLRMVAAGLSTVTFDTASDAPLKLTLSIGVAEHSAGDTTESLTERADAALYEAKRLGRNRVVSKAKPTLKELMSH